MGKRREPRKPVEVEVRIFGTDQKGRIFSEKVRTVDVSRTGVKLAGVKAAIGIDEVVGLTCGQNKVHFRVKWVGQPGTPNEGMAGLLNLSPERPLWDFNLPLSVVDTYKAEIRSERRKHPRVACNVPVELRPPDEAKMFGKASDLSAGGCFIEMPIPFPVGAGFEMILWIGETKLQLQGEVASSAPGFGIGVRFLGLSPQAQTLLRKHVEALSHELA